MGPIMIVTGSNRTRAQSSRVGAIVQQMLAQKKIDTDILDLSQTHLPFWDEDKGSLKGIWGEIWPPVSRRFTQAEGFVFITPEYNGMVTPHLKNIFLLCSDGELAHKPGLIISISSGTGGTYPVSELRMSGYKNTKINWIPEHLILKNVEHLELDQPHEKIPSWLPSRMEYTLNLLVAYAKALGPVRDVMDEKRYGAGM
jgi:NAD(P)H-dependent FMN reductase